MDGYRATPEGAWQLRTLEEAAAYLHTPVATLRYWRHLGTAGPRSMKIGRRVMYRQADIDAYIERQAADTGGGSAA